eukprot:TRINITY_DN507_c1_g1_i1.p1 TRINITY_DN507_c1_g1~~TRINITY_DN507_c1_g1_i1.p1  ORF type:complete len:497 (+),score=10.09 TRINITY_DN507_c1_g1_i1:126-1493(+)
MTSQPPPQPQPTQCPQSGYGEPSTATAVQTQSPHYAQQQPRPSEAPPYNVVVCLVALPEAEVRTLGTLIAELGGSYCIGSDDTFVAPLLHPMTAMLQICGQYVPYNATKLTRGREILASAEGDAATQRGRCGTLTRGAGRCDVYRGGTGAQGAEVERAALRAAELRQTLALCDVLFEVGLAAHEKARSLRQQHRHLLLCPALSLCAGGVLLELCTPRVGGVLRGVYIRFTGGRLHVESDLRRYFCGWSFTRSIFVLRVERACMRVTSVCVLGFYAVGGVLRGAYSFYKRTTACGAIRGRYFCGWSFMWRSLHTRCGVLRGAYSFYKRTTACGAIREDDLPVESDLRRYFCWWSFMWSKYTLRGVEFYAEYIRFTRGRLPVESDRGRYFCGWSFMWRSLHTRCGVLRGAYSFYARTTCLWSRICGVTSVGGVLCGAITFYEGTNGCRAEPVQDDYF